jgi:hypothetical protein
MFREVGGRFEVPEQDAYSIATRSLFILGRRLGMVSMTAIRPLRIEHQFDPYDLGQEYIPESGAHNVILTYRQHPFDDNLTAGHRYGAAYLAIQRGTVIGSQSVVSVTPAEATHHIASARMVHQLTHTFGAGVGHCPDEACIMQPSEVPTEERLRTIIMAEDPYCLDHHIELGSLAAEAQLQDYQ